MIQLTVSQYADFKGVVPTAIYNKLQAGIDIGAPVKKFGKAYVIEVDSKELSKSFLKKHKINLV